MATTNTLDNHRSFSWDLHYTCNYRCPYCWWHGKWQDLARFNRYLSVEGWVKYWSNIHNLYGCVHIEIVGGEPFIYPDFKKLVSELSKMHTLGVTTNLSTAIEDFVEEIDPKRVKIMPTFHPMFSDFDAFLKKAILLKERGFTEGVSYLAYPPQIKFIDLYRNKFSQEKIPFYVMTFWGNYNGIEYPQGYTEEEKSIINRCLGDRQGEKFQLVPKNDFKGKLCHAGHYYAVIQTNGTVLRCGGSGLNEIIGNFFDENFRLLDKALPCNAEVCRCNEWTFLLEKEEKKETYAEKPAIEVSLANVHQDESLPKEAPYRVFWNWDILYECNYSCSYCDIALGKFPCTKGQQRCIEASLSTWERVWDRIFDLYYSCVIRISGGEPTIHPAFFELTKLMQKRHTVDLTTNLSFDVDYFLKMIDPENIKISASFHPQFVSFDEFLKKIVILKDRAYHLSVCFVTYPPFLEKMDEFKKAIEGRGIMFNISPFDGVFNGKKYPQAYTDAERDILRRITDEAFLSDSTNQKRYEWKVEKIRNMKGRLCRMGQMYAKILPNGEVTRCCVPTSGKLGNILDENFRLLDAPKPCQVESVCPCFKAMLVGEEGHWLSMWGVAGALSVQRENT